MKKWWWRMTLLAIGLVLISCSLCLIVSSRWGLRREVEQDTIPIEMPAESRWLVVGTV